MNDSNFRGAIPKKHNQSKIPDDEAPVFLAIGKLRQAHGFRGEINMEVLTDFPERIREGNEVFLGDEHQPLRIKSVRPKDRLLLLSFDGYEDRDSVELLRNQIVFSRADNLPDLPADSFYHHQLLGLRVMDETGSDLGIISEILATGSNDVFVVHRDENSEILLPAIESVILKVDLENHEMIVRPPEWAQ